MTEQKKEIEIEKELQSLSLPVLKFSLTSEEDKLLVPLFMLGKFYHPQYGEIEYTEKDYIDIKNNIVNNVLGFTPYITHGHINSSNQEEEYVEQVKLEALSTDAELKRGEFKDVFLKDNIVYGLVNNINPNTKKLIKSKEYEFASGEFIKNFIDKKSGKNLGTVLFRTALTNAPFMPFDDKKLQLLSQRGEESLQNDTNFMVKLQEDNELESLIYMSEKDEMKNEVLSTAAATEEKVEVEVKDEIPNNEVEKEVEEVVEEKVVETEVEEKAEEKEVEKVVETKVEEKMEEVNEIKQEEVSNKETVSFESSQSVEDQINDQSKINPDNQSENMSEELNSLKLDFSQQLENIKSLYEEQFKALKEASETQVETLKSTISELTNKLTHQEQMAHQFSASLANKRKQERYNRMAQQGVTPAIIEKFSTLESAIEGASIDKKVLKFSTSEGTEEELNILDSLESILIDATKAPSNISVHRFGQTEFQSEGLAAELQEYVKRSKEIKK